MSLSLASSWFNLNLYTPEKMVKKLVEFSIDSVELQYRMPAPYFKELHPLLKKEGIKVSSLHNYFPVPEIVGRGSGDAFLLTSLDDDELKLAVKYSSRSIEVASMLEAPAVVFHTGSVPLSSKKLDEFYDFFDRGEKDKAEKILGEISKEREKKSQLYLDRLLVSLDRIVKVAEKEGVKVGIENRYHPHEIPLPHELKIIFREFEGAPIFYWHDVGHAHHLQVIGFLPEKKWLEEFKDFLIGIHLHDARGREDHLAPGKGEIDFPSLLGYISNETIKVVEAHPKVKERELVEGFDYLKEMGFVENSGS
jgi:sugar phosphate isomerase/epimerase